MTNFKGLLVDIYSNSSNCSNDGISNRYNRALIIGDDIDEIFENSEWPVLRLEKGSFDGIVKAVVVFDPDKPNFDHKKWSMFGGQYIASCDSRFDKAVEKITEARFYGAVALHDRYEG